MHQLPSVPAKSFDNFHDINKVLKEVQLETGTKTVLPNIIFKNYYRFRNVLEMISQQRGFC